MSWLWKRSKELLLWQRSARYVLRVAVTFWMLTWLLADQGLGGVMLAPNLAVGILTGLAAAVYLVVRLQMILLVPAIALRALHQWITCCLPPAAATDVRTVP